MEVGTPSQHEDNFDEQGTSRMEKSLAIMSRMAAGEVIILGNRLRFTEYLVAFAPLLALRYRHLISMYDQPCRPTTTLF